MDESNINMVMRQMIVGGYASAREHHYHHRRQERRNQLQSLNSLCQDCIGELWMQWGRGRGRGHQLSAMMLQWWTMSNVKMRNERFTWHGLFCGGFVEKINYKWHNIYLADYGHYSCYTPPMTTKFDNIPPRTPIEVLEPLEWLELPNENETQWVSFSPWICG